MKIAKQVALLGVWIAATTLQAEESLLIEARIIETAPRVRLTKEDCLNTAALTKKGAQVLNSPRLTTSSGTEACLFVGAIVPVPRFEGLGFTNVQTGLEMKILPRIEGKTVHFAMSALVRQQEHVDMTPGRERADFSVHECYHAGSCRKGETVLIEPRGSKDSRPIYICLTFARPVAK